MLIEGAARRRNWFGTRGPTTQQQQAQRRAALAASIDGTRGEGVEIMP